jgi:hypothetical protein
MSTALSPSPFKPMRNVSFKRCASYWGSLMSTQNAAAGQRFLDARGRVERSQICPEWPRMMSISSSPASEREKSWPEKLGGGMKGSVRNSPKRAGREVRSGALICRLALARESRIIGVETQRAKKAECNADWVFATTNHQSPVSRVPVLNVFRLMGSTHARFFLTAGSHPQLEPYLANPNRWKLIPFARGHLR